MRVYRLFGPRCIYIFYVHHSEGWLTASTERGLNQVPRRYHTLELATGPHLAPRLHVRLMNYLTSLLMRLRI